MFTKIRLQNFKSFKDVELDFSEKKNKSKDLVVIYGINGSGKTTIVQSFSLLQETMKTMQVRDMLNDILEDRIVPPEDFPLKQDAMLRILKSKLSMNSIENLISKYKMIDSKENMSLEYEFVLNGDVGSYYIEMDENSIVKERLEFKLNKRRGCYFNIEDDDININNSIFESKDFYNLVNTQAKMFWGKHSMLSILLFEMGDKSDTFINSNISSNLMKVLLFFEGINCGLNYQLDKPDYLKGIFDNLQMGAIGNGSEPILNQVESILDKVLKTIFNDIEKVYYKRKQADEEIIYKLFLRKRVEDRVFDIDFRLESAGTKEILNLLPLFVAAAAGDVVVIDEYGNRMHDVLAATLLNIITTQIKGQLIITTHNTMIMENEGLKPESLYFIKNDKTFKKTVECVSEIENRIHPNYNYRTRYLTNENYYDSMPNKDAQLDLTELVTLFKQTRMEG